MKIGEFATKTETPIDTLRYYDQIGLLVPKRKHGIRIYDEMDFATLQSIQVLKAMHYSLEDIKVIIELDQAIDAHMRDGVDCFDDIKGLGHMLDKKYDEILKQEAALKKAKQQISQIRTKLKDYLLKGEQP